MAWPAPHLPNQVQAQWNTGMINMPMQDMNMKSMSYTPEQWAMMQQQNWQTWTQWQQQYTQWQNQYGDKYAQQLQAVQNMGAVPPPPPSGAAPPPPPDKPPPPPPHENNQPLFNSNKEITPSVTVPPPQQRNNSNYSSSISGTGNTQWSYNTDSQPYPAANTEALKKLAEEERLFDIQFQKWEQEIEKWRQENLNHPDKQAYRDYEAKFEACRKQLLERRQQMKLKRANLLNIPTQVNTGNTSVAAPSKNSNQNSSYSQKPPSQSIQNKSYDIQFDSSKSHSSNNVTIEPQDIYESYPKNNSGNHLQNKSDGSNQPQNKSDGNNFSPQANYSKGNMSDNSFLPSTSSSNKGIPGLDLVPETHVNEKQSNVIDITDDHTDRQQTSPDYSNISIGINNILGDEKIMNILSMVSGLKPQQDKAPSPIPPNNQGNRNQNYNQPQQYGDRQNNMNNNRQGQYGLQQNQDSQYPGGMQTNRQDTMPHDQYYDQNAQYAGPDMRGGSQPRGPCVGPGMRLGGSSHQGPPGMNQGGPGMNQGGPGMNHSGPGMNQGGPGMNQGGPRMRPSGPGMNQVGPGMKQGGPGMNQGGPGMNQGGPGINQGGPGMRPSSSVMTQGGSGMRPSGPGMNHGVPGMRPGGPGMRPGGPGMNQGGPSMNQGGPGINQGGPGINQGGPGVRQNGPGMNQGGPGMHQGSPGMHQGGPGINQGGPGMHQGGPGMRINSPGMNQGSPGMNQGSPGMRSNGPGINQGGPGMRLPGPGPNQGGPGMRSGGPNMQQPPPPMQNRAMPGQPNTTTGILSLLDVPLQQNTDYYGGQRAMPPKQPEPQPQPKPQWVEEPMFTPSIVVEYEHKSLRLKAQNFIEPVHTFDYNHVSKDGENKRKDFEHEVEELFTRKPRWSDKDYGDDRFDKGDLYQRDYDRRGSRDDFYMRDTRDARELREMRVARDVREPRDSRELRDTRDLRDRDPRDIWENRDNREPRDLREPWDSREPRDTRDMREPRESRDYRDLRELRDSRDSRARDDIARDRNRDDHFERRRDDDRRRDDRDRDRHSRRDDHRDRDRDNRNWDSRRDDNRDSRRDDKKRSISKDRDSRKRGLSRDSENSNTSKKLKDVPQNKPLVMIDDLLEPPGRDMRPEKIVIILRGIPGSGKSYLAKLIRDREAEYGGTARIMSIDDYFMQEGEIEETDPATGKIVKKPSLKYEYDASMEETYVNSLKRAFRRTITDGYFSFLIFDAVNSNLPSYADIWNFARQNGFQVYICSMEVDVQSAFKRNIHNRSLSDIEVIACRFYPTPAHHIQLDATTLLQNAAITEVQMEDVSDDVVMEDVPEEEVESVFTSKWEKMDDANKLARLDGISKPLRPSQLSMEDYLQLDDWTPNKAKPGKKTVRWADIEERRQQEKMRAIGFVVGQTDWNRMTDPTLGSSALTQTKYIERVRRN